MEQKFHESNFFRKLFHQNTDSTLNLINIQRSLKLHHWYTLCKYNIGILRLHRNVYVEINLNSHSKNNLSYCSSQHSMRTRNSFINHRDMSCTNIYFIQDVNLLCHKIVFIKYCLLKARIIRDYDPNFIVWQWRSREQLLKSPLKSNVVSLSNLESIIQLLCMKLTRKYI